MSESEARVNVRIYDHEYLLRTSDGERLARLARQIDARMREIAGGSGTVDTLKVAILAALSVADELERTRHELRTMDEIVSRRSLECVSLLDGFLQKSA